jgi:hypothetical protein
MPKNVRKNANNHCSLLNTLTTPTIRIFLRNKKVVLSSRKSAKQLPKFIFNFLLLSHWAEDKIEKVRIQKP